jgi:integrase
MRAIVARLCEPYASLVLLLWSTGLRIGEAVAIRHEDLEDGFLHIKRRIYEGQVDDLKTASSCRVLPIPESLLTRLRNLSLDGWVFQAGNGSPIDPKNAIVRHVKPAAVAAGIGGINWHSFRHSFSANQRRQGTHPKVISSLLGHSRVQLAMDVYDHVDVEELRGPLAKMLRSRCEAESAETAALIPKDLVGPPGFEPGANGL